MIKKIELIGKDTFNEDCAYYLYDIEEEDKEYFISTNDDNPIAINYSDKLINRKDMTDKEFKIARELFIFLWSSSNGINTCEDYEQLEEEDISKKEVEDFIKKFSLEDGLDMYEEDGVEIMWDYLCRFNLKTCDFWGK